MTESRFGFLKEDFGESVEWYQKAAEQGDATAQFYLGLCYDKGKGVAQDYEKAVEWYQKAADQGNAFAQSKIKEVQKR